ncbi:MAG: hypothetical protein KDB14_05120 [Planctomycetales bacterium]|nr:hypothetical protein [Planctomycetales bacterium]
MSSHQQSEREISGQLDIRAATVNEESRTVDAVLSTERPVEMWDWRSGGMIDEVLLADGVELPRQLPLLDTHSRFRLSDVLGSIRNIRQEGAETVGTLHFASGDDEVDRVWNKVRQGHLTDVSVGYRVTEYIDIQPDGKASVNGREFAAGNRPMRVATKWKLREASMVPIGADEAAKLRQQGELTMAKPNDAPVVADAERQAPPEKPAEQREAPVVVAPTPSVDEGAIRAEAIKQERERVNKLRELAGDDVSSEVLERAISEGWDEARANREFLQHIRDARQPGQQTGPAIHSRSHDQAVTERSLAAGMLIAGGFDPTKVRVDAEIRDGSRYRNTFSEQEADGGHELRNLSAVDLCRECVMLDGRRTVPRDRVELIRAAMSGTHLDRVFTSNVYARLMAGWDETPDTTAWCQAEDVPNFMLQEDITLRQNASLEKLPRGDTATHADFSDDYETYKVARYAKQFVADEQDFIDDRLMALMNVPLEMGAAARRLIPDLVYSLLLSNPTLTATTGALFNATAESTAGGHANLTTAVLGSTGLKAGITAMANKRLDNVPLNIRPQFLLIPPDLEWTGKELLQSGEIRDTTASTRYGTVNVLRGENLTLVVESRLDATGVIDPSSKAAVTGSATNWFLAANRRTVKKLYRQGTSRSPQLRSFLLSQGQWGMGWDINMDAGAAAVDYRGMHKSAGTG